MEGGGSHVEPFRALHESVDGPVTLKRDGDVLFGTGMMLVASRSVGPTASLREVLKMSERFFSSYIHWTTAAKL